MVRKINGLAYRPFMSFKSKAKAQDAAKSLRKRVSGYRARVVPIKHGKYKWSVITNRAY